MQSLVIHGLLGFFNDDFVRSGRIKESLETAMRSIQKSPEPESGHVADAAKANLLQFSGQLMLLLDRPEDALEHFEQCMKFVPLTEKGDRQARSCLIAGLQCMERNQIRTAWSCFKRTLDVRDASLSVQVEACAAMALLFFSLGMRRPAENAVRHGLDMLDAHDPDFVAPRAILAVLRVEFEVLDHLRRHESLEDLAFWPKHGQVTREGCEVADALVRVAACRANVGQFNLLTARLDFLAQLLKIAYFGSDAIDSAAAHIESMLALKLTGYVHAARHELALACIAARHGEGLRRLMQPYALPGRASAGQQHNFEHEYCLAKLGELTGRDDAYISHYRKYASQALSQVRRTCAYITVPTAFRNTSEDIVRDDIASRLPSRYRRAYQFILVNLQQRDLSVRDVADSIGVTERALQVTFRTCLGQSPSAVIKQCRMERIHGDLSEGAAVHGRSMLSVAQRWGVSSRSGLSSAYQNSFGEAPADTAWDAD